MKLLAECAVSRFIPVGGPVEQHPLARELLSASYTEFVAPTMPSNTGGSLWSNAASSDPPPVFGNAMVKSSCAARSASPSPPTPPLVILAPPAELLVGR